MEKGKFNKKAYVTMEEYDFMLYMAGYRNMPQMPGFRKNSMNRDMLSLYVGDAAIDQVKNMKISELVKEIKIEYEDVSNVKHRIFKSVSTEDAEKGVFVVEIQFEGIKKLSNDQKSEK